MFYRRFTAVFYDLFTIHFSILTQFSHYLLYKNVPKNTKIGKILSIYIINPQYKIGAGGDNHPIIISPQYNIGGGGNYPVLRTYVTVYFGNRWTYFAETLHEVTNPKK